MYVFILHLKYIFAFKHFTFMHLADTFIQSDLHCIEVSFFFAFYQLYFAFISVHATINTTTWIEDFLLRFTQDLFRPFLIWERAKQGFLGPSETLSHDTPQDLSIPARWTYKACRAPQWGWLQHIKGADTVLQLFNAQKYNKKHPPSQCIITTMHWV